MCTLKILLYLSLLHSYLIRHWPKIIDVAVFFFKIRTMNGKVYLEKKLPGETADK
jgi:hypothetical protein